MTKEETDLLFKDICGRLPYGVKAKVYGWDEERGEVEIPLKIYSVNTDGYVQFEVNDYDVNYLAVDDCLFYLRPMSSMTDEERAEYRELGGVMSYSPQHDTWAMCAFAPEAYDWLNKKQFDYRGLISMGLALEAPEDMYNTKNK